MWVEEIGEQAALQEIEKQLPDLAGGRIRPIGSGWDSHAFDVDDTWIVRVPQRRETEESLRREVGLLAALKGQLPSPIPVVERVTDSAPICVVTRKIAGRPTQGQPRTGTELGSFLAALHVLTTESLPLATADVGDWIAAHEERRSQFERSVFPLLTPDERRRAEELFGSVEFDFVPVLVHGDLGPEHVLCAEDGRVSGIIDWGDARIGDPAIDLAWALHSGSPAFSDSVEAAYGGVSPKLRERAAFYHRRGPWYEVLYGLDVGRPEFVTSGLAGLRARL